MKKKYLYARDGGICRYCGKELSLEEATRDHIIPRAKGGRVGKNAKNVVTACFECNVRKGKKLLSPSLGIGTVTRKQWKKLGSPLKLTNQIT